MSETETLQHDLKQLQYRLDELETPPIEAKPKALSPKRNPSHKDNVLTKKMQHCVKLRVEKERSRDAGNIREPANLFRRLTMKIISPRAFSGFCNRIKKGKTPDECWIWHGARGTDGYGVFYLVAIHRSVRAHRLSYEMFNGEIPEGMVICHRCDNPICVNPAHLWAGTSQQNTADRDRKGRTARGATHHSRLHPEKIKTGEGTPNAKLTNAQVSQLRQEYKSGGITQRDLARRYGLSQVAVCNILHGKTYPPVMAEEEG